MTPGAVALVTRVVEPLTPASALLLGLDLNAEPELRATIERAVDSGRVQAFAASANIGSDDIGAIADQSHGLVLIKALYKGRMVPTEQPERRRQLFGLLLLYNDTQQLFAGLVDEHAKLALKLELLQSDGADDGTNTVLFERESPPHGALGEWFTFQYQHIFQQLGSDFRLTATWFPDASILSLGLLVPLLWVIALIGLATIFVWYNRRATCIREQRSEQAINTERERAQVTLQSIGDGVIRTDCDGRIEWINPAAEHLIGLNAKQATGRPLDQVLSIVDQESGEPIDLNTASLLSPKPASAAPPGSETQPATPERVRQALLLRHDGESVAIDETITPLRDQHGRVSGAVLVFRDVGVERRLHCQLSYQATHDALTDLINRHEFERLVQLAITDARASGSRHALFYMDLDQFKVVNDSCGHGAGDLLLKQVSGLLQQHIRLHDTLARLGGDEFGVLLRDCPIERGRTIAEQMRHEIRAYRFHWHEQTFDIRVSIGVVPIDAATSDLTEVLSSADSACYVAKDHGRDLVHVSEPDDRALAQRHGEMQWLQRLQNALQDDRLELVCQRMLRLNPACPKQDVFEFLLRLRNPSGDLVSPMAFLPAAERYNMMADIDHWVVDRALAEIAAAAHDIAADAPPRMYTINLSGQSLGDPNTTKHILERLERSQVPPGELCFEITETSAIANLSEATHLMKELKKRGCAFALDDFGSGLSSFGYLKKLPVDYLKIDGAFVRNMVNDRVDAAMVESIHKVGRVLGIHTIAEFVEDQATLNRLREMGIDYALGYHIHRPSPLEDAV